MQVVSVGAMEAPSGRDIIKDTQVALYKAIPDADPANYVRGQYEGYLDVNGVADHSTTETFSDLKSRCAASRRRRSSTNSRVTSSRPR